MYTTLDGEGGDASRYITGEQKDKYTVKYIV